MKTRLALILVSVLALTPATVAAQDEASPAPDSLLVQQLCAAATADEVERDACVSSVESALDELEGSADERTLLEQAADIVDDTLEDLREIDVEGAFDDLMASAQDFELDVSLEGVQESVDQAVADAQQAIAQIALDPEIDFREALDQIVDDALASTEDLDLGAALDDALAELEVAIEDADVQGRIDDAVMAIEGGVEDARAVIDEAQLWVQDNREAVCQGSSLSVGTVVALVVFVETGLAFLATAAGGTVERVTNAVCGDITG